VSQFCPPGSGSNPSPDPKHFFYNKDYFIYIFVFRPLSMVCAINSVCLQGYHGLMKEKERWEPPETLLPAAHQLAWPALPPPRLEGVPGPPPDSTAQPPQHPQNHVMTGDPNGEPPPGNTGSPASTGTTRQPGSYHPIIPSHREKERKKETESTD
jgi:hypothetical protein